ncbi:MAG: rRNA maturation RNase YbeY [Bacillota bacterium]|nr:rRNA maturation RNase YbeY [Bacillota bacterium]
MRTGKRRAAKRETVICISSEVEDLQRQEEIYTAIKRAVKVSLEHYRIKSCEVSLLLTDDQGIRELNQLHRNIDTPTDVLSFPQYHGLAEIKGISFPYLGDIVISIETAQRQATEFGHSTEREISYLTVHSILHLLGYDHMEEKEKWFMRCAEKEIMKKLGVFKNMKEDQ